MYMYLYAWVWIYIYIYVCVWMHICAYTARGPHILVSHTCAYIYTQIYTRWFHQVLVPGCTSLFYFSLSLYVCRFLPLLPSPSVVSFSFSFPPLIPSFSIHIVTFSSLTALLSFSLPRFFFSFFFSFFFQCVCVYVCWPLYRVASFLSAFVESEALTHRGRVGCVESAPRRKTRVFTDIFSRSFANFIRQHISIHAHVELWGNLRCKILIGVCLEVK